MKRARGTIDYIDMDEPYYYPHFYNGKQACHWPTAAVAHEIGAFINELRAAKDLSEFIQMHPRLWLLTALTNVLTKYLLLFGPSEPTIMHFDCQSTRMSFGGEVVWSKTDRVRGAE